MEGMGALQILGIMLILASGCLLAFYRLRVPNIVIFIIAGLLVVPTFQFLDWAFGVKLPLADSEGAHTLEVIAKIGIALLLFLVGLELSLAKIRDVGKVAVAAGIGQVVFTAAGGFLICLLLGFPVVPSVVISVALTFSSTVVVVKLLDQKRELDSLYGRMAVGIFLVQDLVVVLVLTVLAGIVPGETQSAGDLITNLGLAFLGMSLLMVFGLAAAKYIFPKPFTWVAQSSEAMLIVSLFWCFLFVLAAIVFNLSVELGAFLAGLSLAQLDCSHDLRRRVRPLVNFFIAIFFLTLGAQMELSIRPQDLFAAVVLSLFVLIGNPVIFIAIIKKMGYSFQTAFLAGVTVAQISEFSFVFAAVAMRSDMIDGALLSMIALIGLITIAASAYMILYNHELYWLMVKWFPKLDTPSRIVEDYGEEPLSNHVVVIGMNTLGAAVTKMLQDAGEQTVAVDTDRRLLDFVPGAVMTGNADFLPLLEEVRYRDAKLVISTMTSPETNGLIAYRCSLVGVPVVIREYDPKVLDDNVDVEPAYHIDAKMAVTAKLAELATGGSLD
jgi:Kef-type K+ transport system membrane component KefB